MTSRKYEQGNIDGQKRGMNGDERLKMNMASPDNVSLKRYKKRISKPCHKGRKQSDRS